MPTCENCHQVKADKDVLPGFPVICKECFARINGIPRNMPPEYYEGYRNGAVAARRKLREHLRQVAFTKGTEELLNEIGIH